MKNIGLILCICFYLLSCGDGGTEVVRVPVEEQNQPPAPPPSAGGKTSFQQARLLLGQYCESCHANSPWLRDEASLKNSSVKARTQNRSMPPINAPRQMPDDKRAQLLNFF